LARSKIINDPSSIEQNAFVFGANEETKGVIVWETKTGNMLQQIQLNSPVIDVGLISSTDDKIAVALLTEKGLSFWEKRHC